MPEPRPRTPKAQPPVRAHGRSLADFGDLSAAEAKLLEACRLGKVAVVDSELPTGATDANRVRAGFVRFLALGGDDAAPVNEHGVQLRGAWLNGILDLAGAKVPCPLALLDCRLGDFIAPDASLLVFALHGSRLTRGLIGDRLRCTGGVFLRNVKASGEVRLSGATIGGNVECSGGRFDNPSGNALNYDGATIGGYAHLDDGFHASGEVRLLGTTIGGNLECRDGRFENASSVALGCDRATIGGDAFLDDGFHASGEVRLLGATIGGNLACSGGSFGTEGGSALQADKLTLKGALFFRDVTAIVGEVDLTSAKIGDLCDDAASWAKASALVLDGFTYARIGAGPTDAESRIAWLDRQRPAHLGADFRPQPWEQLIQVLRAMGHPGDARQVAIAKQVRLRQAGRITGAAAWLHWVYGLLVGYGYRPLRLVGWMVLVWLVATLAFWGAANPRFFGSTAYLVAPTKMGADAACLAEIDPLPCAKRTPDYATFVAPAYALDVLLPVVNLNYETQWQPVLSKDGTQLGLGHALRGLVWFEIVFGWIASLLLVGVLGNLIKKD